MALAQTAGARNAQTTFQTLVDNANLAQKESGLWARFAREYSGQSGQTISITVNGALPDIEVWRGEKNIRGTRKRSIEVPFDVYHKSMELPRRDVDYDNDGSTGLALQAFTSDVAYFRDRVAFDVLMSNPLVADGTQLLANTHNFGTYDNLTTAALNFDSFDAGREAMQTQLDEFGEVMDVTPDTLLVSPQDERIGLEIAQADARPVSVGTGGPVDINGSGVGSTSIANVYRGSMTLVVSRRVTAGKWLMFDSRYPAIALGVWSQARPVMLDRLEDEPRFRRDVYQFSVEQDLNAKGLVHHGAYGNL